MSAYASRLATVCHRLNAEAAHVVVIGAMAMQRWGTSRATRDVDILIEPTLENAQRVSRALSTLGVGLASEQLAKEVAQRPVTMIGDRPHVDILTRAWIVVGLMWRGTSISRSAARRSRTIAG